MDKYLFFHIWKMSLIDILYNKKIEYLKKIRSIVYRIESNNDIISYYYRVSDFNFELTELESTNLINLTDENIKLDRNRIEILNKVSRIDDKLNDYLSYLLD